MGKIRVKALGVEELEEKQKEKAKVKKEQKQARKTVKGAHGGERVVAIGPTEEELERLSVVGSQLSESGQSVSQLTGEPKTGEPEAENRKQKTDNRKKRTRSRKYQTVAGLVEKNKLYSINEALSLLAKLKTARFDETVELHINTVENGISGNLTLPHGTGKKTRVAIADPTTSSGQVQLDELLKKIEKGKIDFDVLLATPDVMPKLAKVAKFLGPRGLMPNPKNGTITDKPAEAAKKYEGGQTSFKTESKTPIIHLSLGKVSFGEKKLLENLAAVFKALPKTKIKNATLKSTMSPGIKLAI